MSKILVIIESGGKTQKIKKILGDKYEVIASIGHILDLKPREMSIDFENNYEPIYEELEGWTEDITKVRSYDELPENAKRYIEFIEKHLGINVYLVSVGPERSQNIIRKELF